MSFPAYPEYKDSGVAWLGAVPSHWSVSPVKAVATFNDEVLTEATDPELEIDYIEISDVEETAGVKGSTALKFGNAPSRARRIARAGDILVSTVRTYLRAIAPVPDDFDGSIASTGFCVIRGRSVNSAFLGYALRSEAFVAEVISRSVGVSYPAINASDLVAIQVSVPTQSEQTAIAAFLDRETTKIDALVAEQERLIALLKEKRQAVISHTVTKGLNPNALMKDSAIEWLGKIPAHWEVKRLRHIARLNPSKGEIGDWDVQTEISFLPMEAIGEDGSLALDRTRPITDVSTGYTYFSEGDVTIAKITPCFENGKGAVMRGLVGGVGFGTTELIVVRPDAGKTTADYLNWIFRSRPFRALGEGSMYGAGGQKRLPDEFVRDFAIGLPPKVEQAQIVSYLDEIEADFDALSTEAQSAITLLQERRAALISAAVTGKIDVRGLVETSQELECA